MPVIIGTSATIDNLACASFNVRDAAPVKICNAAPSKARGRRPHTTHKAKGPVVPLGGVIRLHSNAAVKATRLICTPRDCEYSNGDPLTCDQLSDGIGLSSSTSEPRSRSPAVAS